MIGQSISHYKILEKIGCQRFVVNSFSDRGASSPITLVIGWDEELKQK